jgi:hypothetical protein
MGVIKICDSSVTNDIWRFVRKHLSILRIEISLKFSLKELLLITSQAKFVHLGLLIFF